MTISLAIYFSKRDDLSKARKVLYVTGISLIPIIAITLQQGGYEVTYYSVLRGILNG